METPGPEAPPLQWHKFGAKRPPQLSKNGRRNCQKMAAATAKMSAVTRMCDVNGNASNENSVIQQRYFV